MMLINRNNYETYFLLWVDGELSSEEKVAVDRFITENPDLAEELALLKSTQLHAEESLVFTNKEILYKKEDQDISLNNYEEWFLLYIDNELSVEQKKQVELFVLQHPTLQSEFEWLQQTRLPEEKLVFPHKEILYRNETSRKGPVLYMRWMRYAAAAAVIGIMATIWMLAPTSTLKESLPLEGVAPELVGNPNSAAEKTVKLDPVADEKIPVQPLGNANSEEHYPTIKMIAGNKQPKEYGNQKLEEQAIVSVVSNNNPLIQLVEATPVQNQEEAISGNSSTKIASIKPIELSNAERMHATIGAAKKQEVQDLPSDKSVTAVEEVKPVYTMLEDYEEDKSLYIGALEINKDRLRGLFRKAGNIFRSKAKQTEEDDRPRK